MNDDRTVSPPRIVNGGRRRGGDWRVPGFSTPHPCLIGSTARCPLSNLCTWLKDLFFSLSHFSLSEEQVLDNAKAVLLGSRLGDTPPESN